jgi:CheY-like chemotaxis protein
MKNSLVKILLVDDDEGNLNVLRLTLAEAYRVLLARDGQEAVEILENREEHRILASSSRTSGCRC